MKKNRIFKYIGSSLLALGLLALIIFLNLSVQKNTTISNENNAKANQQTKLNVAIVNEDKPVYVDTKEYNLGASYVKNIERDNSQNWSVVPRGAADSGLESGKYQLVLTIPSDFSEKILDINSINVDKTTINYKVNAQGNLQVENDANKLAKDIVADLNGQLVDMYMASILNNLYTAQKNVQASSQIQATNIGNYRTNLYNTAINSKNLFPTLYSMSSSSVDANSALKTGLDSYSQIFGRYDVSQIAYGKKLDTLLQDRVTEKKNHADVITGLISQSWEDVKGQIETYKELIKAQRILTSNIDGTPASTDGTSPEVEAHYKKVADNISKEIATLETNLTDERTKFENHKKDIRNFVDEKLAAYYETSEKNNITLGQFLDKAANKDLEKVEESLKTQLASAISELPKEDFSGKEFSGFGMTPITIPSVNYTELKTIKEPSDEINSTDLKNLEDLAISSTSAVGRTGTKAKVSWKAGTGVTVHSVTYDGTPVEFGQEIDLKTGGTFKVAYSVAEAAPTPTTSSTGAPSPTPKAEPKTVDISLNDVQAASAPVDVLRVQQAAVSYGQKVQKIASDYQKVQALTQAYNTVKELKNSNVSKALSDIWFEAIDSNLKKYEDSLTAPASDTDKEGAKEKVDKALSELTTLKPVLEKNVKDVLATNQELDTKIKKQLELYEQLEGKLKDLVEKQGGSNSAFEETDKQLATLNSDYAALLSETTGVKESSQSNVKAAESVNETLGNFNRELSNAQTSTEKLSQDADSLMTQFNEELTNNGNFVESFVKVLNNAYQNGVPNEVLLNFLSNPVTQNATSVKATVNVYRPFTWILLLEIVSLFTAYLFATQNVIRKVKDKFKLDKLHDTDLMTVTILSALSLVVGLVVGVVSSVQLQVGREYQPSWVLLIVLAAFVLIQGQYLLLKHFRVIGMGLSFFMMISFVYLSNAIGTTASLTGFPAFIKNLNALSILEGLLSGYFDGHPAAIIAFVATIVVIAVLLVINVFIRESSLWFQASQAEKE
ncbi:Chromosome partition protein Smc [Streptococcus sp. BCA20]|uniref:type VII secretion protein EsaA n=1 Tax=Streptococcus TaxID=1301 RepID=UPI00066A7D91|nr:MULTISPECIES: type VII secretion protein EsaA [Streptococcus]MDO6346696.1 type VII secretion protein EsaA [Streptococcus sp. GP0011]OFO20348.1 phage infection protein [Streptococcus sp. HMSC072D05]RSH96195.1 Chromosome partition protein Smc [Streptococcus oralis]RSJ36710.1 Chromosome partition protein Smc [Streptococcus sp. BCA20]